MNADTIASLREKLRRAGSPPAGAEPLEEIPTVSTGIDALDRLLPEGGLRRGMLLEMLVDGHGSGGATLAMRLAAAWQRQDRVQGQGGEREILLVDRSRTFYPAAADRVGIDLRRMVVVHPANQTDAVWVLEQSLRCRGLGVVVGSLGRTNDVVMRRLQLAVEAGETVGILLRSADCARQTSWGDVRWRVRPRGSPATAQGPEVTRRIEVELLHSRGRLTEGHVMLEFDDETGAVCEVPQLAGAADAGRRATA